MKQAFRKLVPQVRPVKLGMLPDIQKTVLDNEVPLFMVNAGEEDLIRIDFVFNAGQLNENKALQASTANMMLLEGSRMYASEEINRLLDFYGTFPNLFIEKDMAGFSIVLINRHLDKIMELCREILFKPAFNEKEFDILIRKRIQRYLVNRERVQNIARESFFESIFGRGHPYGRLIIRDDFDSISTDDLRHFHSKWYNPVNMAIFASGRINDSLTAVLNRFFGDIPKDAVADYDNYGIPSLQRLSPKKTYIKKEGAIQSAIRIGRETINKNHPDYHALKVTNAILGGYFGSRLMKNIREEKGFTYGIHSVVASLKQSGFISISTEVGSSHTREATREIYNEIAILQDKAVGAEELNIVKGYMMGELVRMFDGPFSIADSFRSVWEYGLDTDYFRKFEDKIKTISPDEIIDIARTYYNIEELHEVITGPE